MIVVGVPPIPTAPAVDGAELLGELRAALTRYVVLPGPQAADAVTLWTAASHAQPGYRSAGTIDRARTGTVRAAAAGRRSRGPSPASGSRPTA